MKVFHCDHCEHLVFFENVQCVKCKHALAYLPDQEEVASFEPAGDDLWRTRDGKTYRLCQNYPKENVCNWAVPAGDDNPLCRACRLTRVIPDLNKPGHREAWYQLEVAKRRLVYTLAWLELPLATRLEDEKCGLAFEFLADPEAPDAPKVLTGHADGVITVNIAEANDAEREKRRLEMHEPYRTLLGHFRHEVGHYYWDRLIKDSPRLLSFRRVFGDESADYGAALQEHYQNGPPADWQNEFISTYATSHPWEDWAETWAHYLHMIDTLETTAACGLTLRPDSADEPKLKPDPALKAGRLPPFDRLVTNWHPVTYVLNNLNRGLGQGDAYPFVLAAPVIAKLRFIHDVIATWTA